MNSLYGLVGFPLGHSFSQKYFTEKFATEKIDASYLNFEIDDIGFIHEIIKAQPSLRGFNVTIPYKQAIIPLLDDISDEARVIGAVNCVKINRTINSYTLTGFNTDAYGFKKSLLSFIPRDLKKAIILGNGGAARAVRYVLASLDITSLTASRTPKGDSDIGYSGLEKYLKDFTLIINTTPLGTWPKTDECPPIPYQELTPCHHLFDLVYNPGITLFMAKGNNAGAHTRNGLEMLTGQAEKAWEIWNK